MSNTHYLQEQKPPAKQIKQNIEEYQERLNLAKLKIIADILDVPLNELTQRDQAYELERVKRKNRIIKWVTSVISALAVLAGISGIYAWNQKNKTPTRTILIPLKSIPSSLIACQ